LDLDFQLLFLPHQLHHHHLHLVNFHHHHYFLEVDLLEEYFLVLVCKLDDLHHQNLLILQFLEKWVNLGYLNLDHHQ
jgi:hypothetical protein